MLNPPREEMVTMKLREWIFRTKIKIGDLCVFLDLDRSYLYKIRKGHCKPSEKVMKKIRDLTLDSIKDYEDLLDD